MSTASLVFDVLAKDRASDKFDKIGRSSSSAGDKLKTFAKAGAFAAGAAAVAAGAALVSMAKGAMEDQKAQALLAKQLKNSAGATKAQTAATEDWITKQGIALGVADDDLRPALARLVAVTKDVDKAQSLASLGMNIAAGTGKSLTTVTAALAKAQAGSLGGLSRLGVATKNADGSTKSLKDITEELSKTYAGSAATAANTAEGKFGRLKLMFDETKESIGSKLLPVLTKMAGWFLSKGLPAISKLGGYISSTFGPIIGKLVGWFQGKLLPALREAFEKALPGLKSAFESIKQALGRLQPAFDLIAKVWVNVLIPALGMAARVVLPLLGKAFLVVATAIGKVGAIGTWLWNGVFQPVFKFIVNGIATVLRWFGDMLVAIGRVPGFDWVGDLGRQINGVADGAARVSRELNKIPTHKNVEITATVNWRERGNSPLGANSSYNLTGEQP